MTDALTHAPEEPPAAPAHKYAALRALVARVPGARFARRIAPRLSKFAVVGALGTLVNLAVLALMVRLGTSYVLGAIIAAEVSILFNFFLQERVVFGDMRGDAGSLRRRFVSVMAFNNLDALIRLPLLVLLVEHAGLAPVPAQAILLAAAFLLRFAFASKIVYRKR